MQVATFQFYCLEWNNRIHFSGIDILVNIVTDLFDINHGDDTIDCEQMLSYILASMMAHSSRVKVLMPPSHET